MRETSPGGLRQIALPETCADDNVGSLTAGFAGVQHRVGSDIVKPTTAIVKLFAVVAVVGAYGVGTRATAETADDRKWVNQCVADNKDAKVDPDVVRKYCMCMNEAMDDNETRSITQFEKANPKIRAKCDRISGWK
jgi:hypothetical protein